MHRIKNLYLKGLSGPKIAKIIGCKTHQVYYELKKQKVSCRTNKENYKIILKNSFKEIASELEAYLLGILLTDGQVQNNKQSSKILRLDLVEQDILPLELLQEYLGIKNRIKLYKRQSPYQNVVRISVPSDKLCENLSKFGVFPRKTFYTKFPDINTSLYKHFIRGCSDGDGCFTGCHWKMTGTIELLTSMQNILMKELGFSKTKLHQRHKNRNHNIRSLEYGGAKQIAKLYKYLYEDSKFYLQRKERKAYEAAKRYL